MDVNTPSDNFDAVIASHGSGLLTKINGCSLICVPFVDPSFIAELEKSGFIKKLYEAK